jgi:hypothetical protein
MAAFIYYLYFLNSEGYLPTPFIFNKFDTFMDLFNTMDWAGREGRYSEWGSIYPPLNFLFLQCVRWLFVDIQDSINPLDLRANGDAVIAFLIVSYLCIPAFVLSQRYWSKFNKYEKILIYFISISSVPMLFALERGNLILFCLLFLPFLFSNSPLARLISIAVLVNIKPYFVLLFLPYIVKRFWDELIVAVMVAGVLYFVTGAILGSEPFALLGNVINFSQGTLPSLREVLAMPSSVSAFAYILGSDTFIASKHSDFTIEPSFIATIIEVIKWSIMTLAAVIMFMAAKRLPLNQLIAMTLVIITNCGMSVGGYTLIIYIALLPIFWEMRLSRIYIWCIVLMSLPLDIIAVAEDTLPPQNYPSFFTNAYSTIEWTVGLGSFVRPTLNLLLLATMAWEFQGKNFNRIANSAQVKAMKTLTPPTMNAENVYAG